MEEKRDSALLSPSPPQTLMDSLEVQSLHIISLEKSYDN
jgi:hypothetical protein